MDLGLGLGLVIKVGNQLGIAFRTFHYSWNVRKCKRYFTVSETFLTLYKLKNDHGQRDRLTHRWTDIRTVLLLLLTYFKNL